MIAWLLACAHPEPEAVTPWTREVKALQAAAAAAPDDDAPRLVTQLGHAPGPVAVASSPDGRWVVTGGADGAAILWDAAGRYLRHFAGPGAPVREVGWVGEDGVVTLDADGRVTVFDAFSGKERRVLGRARSITTGVSLVVRCGKSRVHVDDMATGRGWEVAASHAVATVMPAFLDGRPAGAWVLVGDAHGWVNAWLDGKPMGSWHIPGAVGAIAVGDGHIYAATGGAVYRGSFGPDPELWRTVEADVTELVPFAGGIAAVGDGFVQVWPAIGNAPHPGEGGVSPTRVAGTSAAPFGDTLLVGLADGTARTLDDVVFSGPARPAPEVETAGSLVVLGGAAPRQQVWDLDEARVIADLATPEARLTALATDGARLAVLDGAAHLDVWSPRTGLRTGSVDLTEALAGATPTSLAVPPEGRVVVGTDSGAVLVVDTATGKVTTLPIGAGRTIVAAGTRLGFATETKRGVFVGWLDPRSVEAPALVGPVPVHEAILAVSPDGTHLAVAGRGGVWELQGTTVVPRALLANPRALAYAADGTLAWAADGVEVAPSLEPPRSAGLDLANGEVVTSLAFARSGGHDWAIGMGVDGRATLWRWGTPAARAAAILPVLGEGSWAVTTPDGDYDAPAAGDGLPLHWVVSPRAPVAVGLPQLQDRFYRPGLLARALGTDAKPALPVDLPSPAPGPVLASAPDSLDPSLRVCSASSHLRLSLDGRVIARPPEPDGTCDDGTPRVRWDLGAEARASTRSLLHLQVEDVSENAVAPPPLALTWEIAESAGPRVLRVSSATSGLHAVVLGVSDYAGAALDLDYPAADAAALRAALRAGSPDAALYQPTRLTRAEILAELRRAVAAAGPEDVLLVFLAGHGLVADGEWWFLGEEATEPGPNGGISASELAEVLAPSSAGQVVLVLDTCASGEAALAIEEARAQEAAAEKIKDRVGLHVLAATRGAGAALEVDRLRHGLLTYTLLETLGDPRALPDRRTWDIDAVLTATRARVPSVGRQLGLRVQPPALTRPAVLEDADLGELPADYARVVPLPHLVPTMSPPMLADDHTWVDSAGLVPALVAALGEGDAVIDERGGDWSVGGRYTADGERIVLEVVLRYHDTEVDRRTWSGTVPEVAAATAAWVRATLAAAEGG